MISFSNDNLNLLKAELKTYPGKHLYSEIKALIARLEAAKIAKKAMIDEGANSACMVYDRVCDKIRALSYKVRG